MIISATTFTETKRKYWGRLENFIQLGFRNIELYNQITRVRQNNAPKLLVYQKKYKLNYSLHSMASEIFSADPVIGMGNLYFLKSEIKIASAIKAKRLIFHIAKEKKLTPAEIKQIKQLADFAKKNNVKLCLENNHTDGCCCDYYIIELLNKIKNLYFCLDVGHLNIALHNGKINDLEKFITGVRPKTAQLHAHYNDGKTDQHLHFNKTGEQYLKIVLGLLPKNLPIVCEARSLASVVKTKKLLEKIIN